MTVELYSPADRAGVAAATTTRTGLLTIAETVDLFMSGYTGRDTTRAHRLAWWASELGRVRLFELDDDIVHAAMERLEKRPPRHWAGTDADGRPIMKARGRALSPASLNRYQAALSALLTWAEKKRLVPRDWSNPCRKLDFRPENNARVRFLTDDELQRLLTACKASKWPKLYLLVLTAITTGARRGELEGLRWEQVDLDARTAYVPLTKNNDRKVLTLVPAVVDELRRLRPSSGSGLVFASKQRPRQAYAFESVWSRALAAAKVKDFRFHDCRHCTASYLAQNGATLLEIADVLGHRQLTVTRRYSHLTTHHKAALVERVLGGIR